MSSLKTFEVLKKDHRRIKAVLAKIKDTTERAEKGREELLQELKEVLGSHARAEEKAVYEPLRNDKDTRAEVLEGYEEHYVADRLLLELGEMPVTDEQWTAKAKVLGESLDHHMREEEEDLFPDAAQSIDAATLSGWIENYESLRDQLIQAEQAKAGKKTEAA